MTNVLKQQWNAGKKRGTFNFYGSMILIRFKNDKEPELIIEGEESVIIKKIHELKLCDWHDSFFYEIGKFENLGLGDSTTYDYYSIYTDIESFKKQMEVLKKEGF